MKTPTPADYRESFLSHIRPGLAEPILASGILTPAGATKGMVTDYSVGKAIGMFSPIVGLLYRRKKVALRTAATVNQFAVATATSVHLFPMPPHPTPFSVTGPPATWSRVGLTATADKPGRLTQQLHVRLADGTEHDVEIGVAKQGGFGDFSNALRDLLLDSSPAAALGG